MNMRKLLPLAILGAFAAFDANAFVIDRFLDTSSQLVNLSGTTNVNNPNAAVTNPGSTSLSNVTRTITVSNVTGLGNPPSTRSARGFIEAGSFSVETSPLVNATVTLSYGFDSADFTAGATAIAMAVDFIDSSTSVLMSIVTATGTLSMASAQNFSGAGSFYAPYSLFTSGTGDLTQVTGLTMIFNGDVSWDATFTLLETSTPPGIPEIDALAGTGALTLLGGALALASERRRRRV